MKKNIVLILLAAILSLVSIVIGKISNNFGTNLGRDLDNDGDNDAGVVINNIAGGNGDDGGNSLYVDNSGKIYVTGYSWNGSNWDMYVIRLGSNGNMDNTFGSNGKIVIKNI
ncbi:MAG: delta-60 repeat domain-containing protein, partial [bacterium]